MPKLKGDTSADAAIARINGAWVVKTHTIIAFCAFFLALVVACWTHYYEIVKNQYYGYPQEWFPSVSATTGDRYPARSIFQIFMAMNSGPRFIMIFLMYLLTNRPDSIYPKVHAIIGLLRTFACGGWVYITSSEDHFIHDVAMISYVAFTLPWMLGSLAIVSDNKRTYNLRRATTALFFGTLVPMIHFFVQHKVHRVAGAYTIYSFFEWSLIIYDVAFDAISLYELASFEVRIVNVARSLGYERASDSPLNTEKADSMVTGFGSALTSNTWNAMRSFVVDTYLAFMYWSILTSLPLTIWYFPLWHMGISGYEVCLLVTASPGLLGIPTIRRFVSEFRGIFHFMSLAGVAAYLVINPTLRLFTVSFAVAIANITWVSTWIDNRDNYGRLERDALVWTLGLIASNVVKMAWWANNPIWPIMRNENGGWNGTGLLLGVLACLEVIMRGDKSSVPAKSEPAGNGNGKRNGNKSWFGAAAGFGSLMFALHSLLSDTSTIMRWVYTGYPNTGPQPAPWGFLTIIAMSLGLVLSTNRKVVIGLPWYVIGCVACAVMYLYPAWNGYYGGFVLAVYIVSLVPTMIRSAVRYPPGRTFFGAMMIYNVIALAHVWVVAYAFVPLGEYMRERTDYVLMAMMALIGLGVRAAPATNFSYKHTQMSTIRSARHFTKLVLSLLIISSFWVMYMRIPIEPPKPHNPNERLITAGIWTIHFALDNDMWASETRMRDVIKELELDVIGLLESDLGRMIMGNRDLTQFLAEDLEMYADYGPGPSKHTWGCTMLSKFPILRSTHHLLPSPVGELACAIHATLDVYGKEVDVIVSHNGQEEDEEDRRLQTTELARIMRESPNPFIFLGYVVTKPHEEIYTILFNDGRMADIDPNDHDRWCEYIGYRELKRTGYARVSHGGITDTEIQMGKFQLLVDANATGSWNASYNRIPEKKVPTELRFPSKFKKPGLRGHRYHVFNVPRYFD